MFIDLCFVALKGLINCLFIFYGVEVGELDKKKPEWKKLNAKDLGISTSMIDKPTRKVLNGLKKKGFCCSFVLSNECNLCCFVWSWIFFFDLLELKFCVMWSWCWLNVGGNDLSLFPYAVYDGYILSKWSYRVNMPWIRYTGVHYLSIWLMTSKLATVWSSSTNDLL